MDETENTITLITAMPVSKMDAMQQKVDEDLRQLTEIRDIPTSQQWDILEAYTLTLPRKLNIMLTRYREANNLLDALELQVNKLRYKMMEQHRRERQVATRNADELEGALLNYSEAYERSVVEYNMQKNFVKWLDGVTDQYRYLKNIIDTKIELVKLRKSIGF